MYCSFAFNSTPSSTCVINHIYIITGTCIVQKALDDAAMHGQCIAASSIRLVDNTCT